MQVQMLTTSAAPPPESSNDRHHDHRLEPSPAADPTPATPRVLSILSLVVERLVARNDRLAVELSTGGGADRLIGRSLSVFDGVRAPSISIGKYLERIYKYTDCSPSCFVVGYVYIDRLLHRHPDSLVISLNVHRLLVTSVMVAAKVLDDEHHNNAFYAKVGGVSNAELNKLEVELLFLLDFGVAVTSSVFETYCLHLEKENMWSGNSPKIERVITLAGHVGDIAEDKISTEEDNAV